MKTFAFGLVALVSTAGCREPTVSGPCDPFIDEPGLAYVTVRIHNETGQTIGVDPQIAYLIGPAGGGDGVSYAPDLGCGGIQTCGEQVIEPRSCAGPCGETGVATIEPGGMLDQTWDGTGLRTARMPAECLAPGACGTIPASGKIACMQRIAAAPGDYVVHADGKSLDGVTVSSEHVTFTIPGPDLVDVVFGPSGG